MSMRSNEFSTEKNKSKKTSLQRPAARSIGNKHENSLGGHRRRRRLHAIWFAVN